MLLKWILDSNPEEAYLPWALEATGAVWKPKQFASHGNTQVCQCRWIIKHFGCSPCAVLFNAYLKSNGAGMCSVCLANGKWQRSVRMHEAKQRTSISVATPLPGLTHLAFILSNLVTLSHPVARWKETLSRHQHSCALSPPSLTGLGPLMSNLHFSRCCRPTQTTEEWYFPLVQVLGKNYMCLLLKTSSPEPQSCHTHLESLGCYVENNI